MPEIRELDSPNTHLAFEAMRALRPRWNNEAEFVRQVNEIQRPEGYRLAGSFDPGREQACGAAGFRTGNNLAWGYFLYVDDLSTVPDARRRGHGRALMTWLLEESERLRCDSLHLDSGVGPSRFDAHRLYLSSGLNISSHHFSTSERL